MYFYLPASLCLPKNPLVGFVISNVSLCEQKGLEFIFNVITKFTIRAQFKGRTQLFFLLPIVLLNHLYCFGLSCRVWQISALDMELDGTWLVLLQVPKKTPHTFEEVKSGVSF